MDKLEFDVLVCWDCCFKEIDLNDKGLIRDNLEVIDKFVCLV